MNHSGVTVARNSLWLIFQPIILSLVSVVVTALVARHLGVDDYGLLLLLISYFMLFSLMASLGLRQYMVREIAADSSKVKAVVEDILWMRMVLAVISGLLLVALNYVVPITATASMLLVWLIAGQIMVHGAAVCFVDALYGLEKMKAAASIQALSGISVQVLLLGGVWLQLGLPAFVFAYLAGSGILLGAGLWRFSRLAGVPGLHWNRRLRWSQASRGWQIFLPSLLEAVRQRTILFMLGGMVGPHAVGIFGAAQTLMQKLDVIPDGIATASFPRTASLHGRAGTELLELVRGTFKVLLILATPISCGLLFVADDIVHLLYGDNFIEAGPVLALLGLSLPFMFGYMFLFNVLAGIREHNRMMYASLVGTGLGIGFFWLGIVYGGVKGASLAFLLAVILSTSLYLYICWQRLGFPLRSWDLLRIGACNLIMVAVLWAMGNVGLAVMIPVGAVVYVGAVFSMRLIGWHEIQAVFRPRRNEQS